MSLTDVLSELDVLRKALNGRAKVEQEMWDIVNGKADMPDREKLREWALRLGIPEGYRK